MNAAMSRYPLGCALCRSEKLEIIADNENAFTGVSLDTRDSMIKRFAQFTPAKGKGPPPAKEEEKALER